MALLSGTVIVTSEKANVSYLNSVLSAGEVSILAPNPEMVATVGITGGGPYGPALFAFGGNSNPMRSRKEEKKTIKLKTVEENAVLPISHKLVQFIMENDFDNGEWIGGEFYYSNRKEKRVRTKDDVLYGIFASGNSSSDSDYEGRGKKRKKDLTKPVNFVSTGSVLPNQKIDSDKEDLKEMEEDRGASSSDNFLCSAFGKKIKEGAVLRQKSSQAGKRESEAGTFEKHTKGIGMKLLEKMGYKGGGLGKNEQGITAPIEAKLRPKNMGMGFNDYKEIKVPALQESEAAKSAPLPAHKREKPWLKQASKKKVCITVEELLARKQEQGVNVVQKVYDMRGPQVRVLTNLENLNAEEKARESDIPMAELQHNMGLMVDLAELEFLKIDRDLRNEREKVVALQKEKEKLQAVAVHQKKQIENMEYIMNELDRIDKASKEGTLTLDSLVNSFLDLQQRYADDYKLSKLSSIACSYAIPLFIRVFQGWDLPQNPTHGLKIVSSWKNLLQDNSSLYSQLFMEVFFPAIRISVTNTWQARDPEPMLRFLDSWEKLLPPIVLHTILDNIVLPKLAAAVDSWDPRRETIPIHSWIHPWLPFLGQTKLESCFNTIRCRLESVLHAWHPSDISAYYILSPWKTVFDPSSWGKLMARFIVPKLVAVMHEFQVYPANQNLDQFHWVRTWAAAIPIHQMLPLMDIFFDKWQQVLYHWLCSNPNFEQVTQWFLGWKQLLPPQLLANNHIRYRLIVGDDMMIQAANGMEVVHPSLRENISYLRALEKRQFEASAQAQKPNLSGGLQRDGEDSGSDLSFKAIIEAYAQQNGLLFKPKPGRIHNGYQIYGFGSLSIIMDSLNEKVYAQIEDKWSPMCLELLLELQNRRQ
ncbi:PREDICTED: septin and tuftelin-interacting protein 1 homolog 1-like [Ipomoea nil]|uniref:septin and tuftelin-interacting protein 1 homolog 1-like n=1 Tax=Ipomoea nil TaxID=35883 RepID=UPI000900BEB9|nr:PREDICTED: septin and tuftelin-interacting protein 1 homolog 1-like [Ipomoea nil]